MNNDDRFIGIIAEKDCNSVLTRCNRVFLYYSGLNYEQVIGYTDYDFSWSEYADIYRQHELDALAGNHYSCIIPLRCYDNNVPLFLHNKIQQQDEHGNVIGTRVHAVEILNRDVEELIYSLSQESRFETKRFCLGSANKEVKLSSRLQEILFYLIRGKSAKQVAKILNLSHRTIETHINTLRTKFSCATKNEVIECAISANFIEMIPVSLSARLLLKGMIDG